MVLDNKFYFSKGIMFFLFFNIPKLFFNVLNTNQWVYLFEIAPYLGRLVAYKITRYSEASEQTRHPDASLRSAEHVWI